MLQIENSTERQPCDAFKFKTRERTFLSEPWPLSEAIDRNLFHSHANKIYFHKKKVCTKPLFENENVWNSEMAYYKLLLDKPAKKTLIKLYFNFNIPLHSPGAWIYLHMSFCLLWECILAYIHSWKIGSCLHSCVRSRRWTQHIRRCLKNRAKTVKSLKLLYFTHKSWKVHSKAMVKCMHGETNHKLSRMSQI